MGNRVPRVIPAILLTFFFMNSLSCYTVLKRPGGALYEEDRYLEQGYYEEDWEAASYLWHDPFYRWYYPESYSRWRYYYGHPWWWDDDWFRHSDDQEGGPPVDTDRHIWDQRRGPDWSAPPTSPSPSSGASQPIQKKAEQEPSQTEPAKAQDRRRADWKQADNRSADELKRQDRGGEENEERRDGER